MRSRQQLKQLQLALISAFPSKSLLERLLYFELEKNLNEITRDNDLQEIVFKLIQTAESQGWLIELVSAAQSENSGNSELAAIAVELLSPETPSAPKQSPSNSVTVVLPKQRQEVEGSSGITSEFDVFLAHNTADKPQVRFIFEKLKQRGLKPWLDEEQIPPGRPFQDEIQQAIPLVKSAAIFLGLQGLGRWQSWELRSLISECVDNKIPVIPVLLPGVNDVPQHLRFLREFRWVCFSEIADNEQALDLLLWGITGEKPTHLLNSTEKPGHVPTPEILNKYQGKSWIFQFLESGTQLRKTLVVSAAIVVVFVLIAYGTTLSFLNPVTEKQPIASSSPTNSTNPSKPSQSTSQQPTLDLSSEKGVDYTLLLNLLSRKEWVDADYETYKVMLKVVGKEDFDLITSSQLLNFPCTDLRTIDSLWVKYSNGRFGFSVQKKIYLSVGGRPDGNIEMIAWNKLGDRVGWRVKQSWLHYSQVHLADTTAPVGHLPSFLIWSSSMEDDLMTNEGNGSRQEEARVDLGFLFSRIQACKL